MEKLRGKMGNNSGETGVPIASGDTPMASGHTPIASGQTPIASAQTPIASAHTPIASAHTPIASAHTPIASAHTLIASRNILIASALATVPQYIRATARVAPTQGLNNTHNRGLAFFHQNLWELTHWFLHLKSIARHVGATLAVAPRYCGTVRKVRGVRGRTYRLPTKAEWGYAARGGNQSKHTQYAGSRTIDEVAWYFGNSRRNTHPVAQKKANELGLYDMTGNVWEWCSDWYGSDYYKDSSTRNPQGAVTGSHRVFRGGSWGMFDQYCRIALRNHINPYYRSGYLGFRIVASDQ